MLTINFFKLPSFYNYFFDYRAQLRTEIDLFKIQNPQQTLTMIHLALRRIDPLLVGERRTIPSSPLHRIAQAIYYKVIYWIFSRQIIHFLLHEKQVLAERRPLPRLQIPPDKPAALYSPSSNRSAFYSPQSSPDSKQITPKKPSSSTEHFETPQRCFKSPHSFPEDAFSLTPTLPTLDAIISPQRQLYETLLPLFVYDIQATHFMVETFFPPLLDYDCRVHDDQQILTLKFENAHKVTYKGEGFTAEVTVPKTLIIRVDRSTRVLHFDKDKMKLTGSYGWASTTRELYRLSYLLPARSLAMTTYFLLKELSGEAPLEGLNTYFADGYRAIR